MLNLPRPPTHFQSYIDRLGTTLEDVCFDGMKDAVEEAVSKNDGNRDLAVALDGTWQKRGHTSLNSVVAATSFEKSLMSQSCPNIVYALTK